MELRMAGGSADVEPLLGTVGSGGLYDGLLHAGAGRGEHAAVSGTDVPERRPQEKRASDEDLPVHAADVSVRHRAGLRAAFDAPVLAGIADVPGRTTSPPAVADTDAAAVVPGDGVYPGICVRFAGA